MAARGLRVADGVELPIEYVTKAAAILAQRRKGKTYAASVIAEELYEHGLPWVALDPTGAWWGLRSSADGESAGIPVVVIGGQHGDLPLDEYAGAAVADLVLDHPGWYVIDLSLLDGRPAERRFATDFGARMHRRKMQPGMDFPLHLFVDEADMFVPQEKETKGDVELLAAYSGIVRRGGLHGLGSTLISQRPALVNKSVLTQLDLLVLLRIVAGNDQDAVAKNYVSRFASKDVAAEIMGSLATLPIGDAWFLEPGADEPRLTRSRARARRTFNSSATPKVGERRVEPKVFAQVDLDALRERMAESVERAKADDPEELRREIARLVRELEEAQAEHAPRPIPNSEDEPAWDTYFREQGWLNPTDPDFADRVSDLVVPAEVPVMTDDDRGQLRGLLEAIETGHASVEAAYEGMRRVVESVVEREPAPPAPLLRAPAAAPAPPPRPVSVPPPRGSRPTYDRPGAYVATDGGKATPSEQKILDALAWYEALGIDQPTRNQVGFVSGYKASGGRFSNLLGDVKKKGLIDYPQGGFVALTREGRLLARDPGLPATNQAMQQAVLANLSPSQARVLEVALGAWPRAITRDQLAAATGYEARGGRFSNLLGEVKKLGLIEYPRSGEIRAVDVLFPVRSAA